MSDSVPAPLTGAEVRAVVLGSVLALFLAALDQSIVATALPAIAAELGRVELMSWVVTAYLLASTCATPVLGKASDVLGRRRVLAGCLIVFLGGSVLCSLATSMPMLIAARALQGLGGGGLITLAQATVADVVAPRERGRYVAYFASVWACAGLLGPTLGGLLTQYLGWPWIFWINLPLGLAALAITDRVLRRLPVRGGARGRIDLPGIGLLSTATTALLLALSFGGHRWPWGSAPILGLLALAVVAALLFAHRQRHTAEPLLPPAFFRDPVVAPTGAALFLVFGGFLAVAVLVPAWLQIGLGRSAAAAGLLMMPMSLAAPLTATLTGHYLRATGRYRRPPQLGLPLAAVALLALAAVAHAGPDAVAAGWLAALLALVGLGIGPIFSASLTAAQNAVEPRDVGAVTGALTFARALGGAVWVATGSALVLGLALAWLPQLGALGGLEELVRRPLAAAERAALGEAFAAVFVAAAGLLLLGLLLWSRVAERPLRATDAAPASAES